jgi:hypothetical protein
LLQVGCIEIEHGNALAEWRSARSKLPSGTPAKSSGATPFLGTSQSTFGPERVGPTVLTLPVAYIVAQACVALTTLSWGAPLKLNLPPLVGADI